MVKNKEYCTIIAHIQSVVDMVATTLKKVNILEKNNVIALFTILEDTILSKEAQEWFSLEKVQLQLTMLNVAILSIMVQTPPLPNSPLIIIHTYDAIEETFI